MRFLKKPANDPRTVFLNCVTAVTDVDLQFRLNNCGDFIQSEARAFEKLRKEHLLHTLVQNKSTKANKNVRVINGEVTINEMKDVYTSFFVPKNSPGHVLYEQIMGMPENRKCPYCFHRQVSTLDHYLSKAYYPSLSVVPSNLIPSCKDCNIGKSSSRPYSPEEEILHPYYDNVEDDLWLKAEVVKTSPVSLRFFVDCPIVWDDLLKSRMQNHFKSLELATLYGAEAANELANLNHQLGEQFSIGGASLVQVSLKEAARSRSSASINSWQAAMYNAVSADLWFCNNGFNF